MQAVGQDISFATKLAADSGQAFEIIVQQTQAVQQQMSHIAEVIAKMQSAGAILERSVEQAHHTAQTNHHVAADMDTLNQQIVTSIEKMNYVVKENTTAAERISAESLEACQAIETIASGSQENNAAVEEVSAATAEMNLQVEDVAEAAYSLSDMATSLQQAIGQFTTSDVSQQEEMSLRWNNQASLLQS